MSISFLNTATMFPPLINWKVGNYVILVDTNQGLVMIDTGLGIHDHISATRWGRVLPFIFGIPFAPQEAAINQLTNAGISPKDVKHIILTHLHFDHAGGLADFPWVKVHLHKKEYEAMLKPKTMMDKAAYDKRDIAHHPHWVTYEECTENWFGFDAIPLPFQPRMYLIPLFGHTSGHCGVVIEYGNRWLFQAGDAMPANADTKITPAWLNRIVLGKHIERIQQLVLTHPNIQVVAGHIYQKKLKTPSNMLPIRKD